MIYAIKITQIDKNLNPKLLGNNSVDEIVKLNQLPKIWNNTAGYRGSASEEQIYNDRFLELRIPTITDTQKLGNILYFEGDRGSNPYYQYDVVDFTQEEIESNLENYKLEIILKFESDTDQLIRSIVGERSNEYQIAEAEGREFKANGYPEDNVPHSVSSDAIANEYSNREACDLILLMAENWRGVQVALRSNRLLLKAQVKKAANISEVDKANESWNSFMTYLKTQITD